jgi:peptidyl-prolyl cis-trans isomerase A (cyclophilin A)
MKPTLAALACMLVSVLSQGCDERLKEPDPAKAQPTPNTSARAQAPSATAVATQAAPPQPEAPKPGEGDPLNGKFTLEDATKDFPGKGALVASMKTSEGTLRCTLFEDKAPITVANFVGLATGKRPWKDPSGAWVKKPAYDGTTFHRIIKGFMIQGGDARGNGTGEPGYVIPDELWAGAKHDRAGLLCMANRGPNTNGAQFFITDAAAAHLDTSYTIFGECSPVDVVHKIAAVPVRGSRPDTPVTIQSVSIAREKK